MSPLRATSAAALAAASLTVLFHQLAAGTESVTQAAVGIALAGWALFLARRWVNYDRPLTAPDYGDMSWYEADAIAARVGPQCDAADVLDLYAHGRLDEVWLPSKFRQP